MDKETPSSEEIKGAIKKLNESEVKADIVLPLTPAGQEILGLKAPEFREFPKIARLSREIIITEKLDGTNALIYITEDGKKMFTGSRTRWIQPGNDNFGFALWASQNEEELLKLGPGYHYGEWWGLGIQRGYGLSERRFSLFNTFRWSDASKRPSCCGVVPVLYQGDFNTEAVREAIDRLKNFGSVAAPKFPTPEGVVIFHTASRTYYKKTVMDDAEPKKLAPAFRNVTTTENEEVAG